ncbi:type III secretion system gatekeeper subunit SctW [Klebsiella sp. BIGb0407]|uniref:type III secretion system gatekeeper subunit SctW n=1 Tax=Klebsiella sp. BIGb0407 TaxID=2940603 RepID=UPI002168EF05|nr:type III secretion system gatekeeper subunit SctW [Klebsiella sp. BIGb0407]MCS3431549.1 type III secretion protein W [Klebsiella sp. BIGb0407]
MVIRAVNPVDFNRLDFRPAMNRNAANNTAHNTNEMSDTAIINFQDEINSAAEEMADLFSSFGRFSKLGRRNDSTENDFVSSMLEDKADEKLGIIVKNISKLQNFTNLLNFARSLFPNDSDLMLALRELLLSRQLSELQKKKIKESISDLEKFCDTKKMNSGINIGHIAKRFSSGKNAKSLSAKELRNSYLRFIELDIPASFIYQDWIDEFGCHNRTRLLSFTLAALVADMKASMPGIHFDEFGPLSAKLSDARVLHTLDMSLFESFNALPFYEKLHDTDGPVTEDKIINLFMIGLINHKSLEAKLSEFSYQYMSSLLIKQRATAVQVLRNVYNITPEFLYAESDCRFFIQEFMSTLMLSMYEKEINNIHW